MYNQQSSTAGTQSNYGRCGHQGFGGHWAKHWAKRAQAGGWGSRRIPVNIEENEQAFIISLFAAGLAKDKLKINVKNDVLTISYEAGENNAEQEQFIHREYNNSSFERSFLLNGKVLTDKISSAYADGILKVTLPKNPETNKPAQSINVE